MKQPELCEIYEYLSASLLPETPQPAVVFGRADPLVARAAGDLIVPGLVTSAVITGGIGKDSGDILNQGFKSEAEYLKWCLGNDSRSRDYKKPLPTILLETKATNGGENARFSLAMFAEAGVATSSLTAVAHATSARRLAETLRFEAQKQNGSRQVVHVKPTNYLFSAKNPEDTAEAMAEFKRLMDWPEKGWLLPQHLPANLVDFVQDTDTKTPSQPSSLAGKILRAVPPKLRVKLLSQLK